MSLTKKKYRCPRDWQNERDLERAGLRSVPGYLGWFQCLQCDTILTPRAKFPRGYWHCPSGCNWE